jgi:hypothetical protein
MMATASEIAARYGYFPEEEEEDIIVAEKPTADSIAARYGYNSKESTPESAPKPTSKAKPNVLTRAVEKIQQGESDAISSLMGETYGRGTAEPTEQTESTLLNMAFRPVAATADVVKGLGGGLGEIIGAADEAIGSPLSRSMAWMSENQSKNPQYGNLGLEQAQTDIKEAYPDAYPYIADAATVVSAGLPYAKAAKVSRGSKATQNLKNKAKIYRDADVARRLEPENPLGKRGGKVVDEGPLQTTRFKPDEQRQAIYDEVAKVEDLNPRKSPVSNFNALDSEVNKLREQLDLDLRLKDYMEISDVRVSINDAMKEARKTPTLKGKTAGAAAKAVDDAFKDILKKYEVDGQIKPGKLLQARRDLDAWLKGSDPNVFEGQSLAGTTIAIKSIRDAINKEVMKAAPDAKVAESLRRQSQLLTARDELIPKGNRQGKNAVSRAVQRTQERYGLALPHSPAAVGANLQALPLAIGGGLAATEVFGRGARRLGNYTGAGLQQTLQELYNPARGAIPSALLEDEEENR